jgi:hypothetical protein
MAYVSNITQRWGVKGNGSGFSRKKATYSTVHHYYCVLKAFFNWCVRENYIPESPLVKVKLANPKLNVVRPYTSHEIMKLLTIQYFTSTERLVPSPCFVLTWTVPPIDSTLCSIPIKPSLPSLVRLPLLGKVKPRPLS